jgi:myo-inositol 2-dehydrogenase / D-chiro-inositol 1-dehydrogenase
MAGVKRMRAAVVGCGPWGQAHMRAFIANPETKLVAVCGRSAERTKTIAAKYGVRAYRSVEDLVRSEKLDLASVSTGELDHFAPTVTLIEAGVPTLVEKSLTFKLEEAKELVALARSRGTCCGVNFNMRYLMPFQLVRQAVNNNELGRPIAFVWKFSHRWPPPSVGQDLAVVITHHIHGLNLLLSFGGPVHSVAAKAAPGQDPMLKTTVGAVLTFESGALGVIYGGVDGSLSNDVMMLECQGTLARATARDVTAEFRLSKIGQSLDQVWTPFFADVDEGNFQKSLDWHLSEFIDAMKDGRPPPVPIEEGYEALRLAWTIIEAAQSGKTVNVDDIAPPVPIPPGMYGAPIKFRKPGAGASAAGYAP